LSTYEAIAGVSLSLQALLRDRMTENAAITIAPPDAEITGLTGRRINFYLYHLSENPFLKNQEIPGEGYPGAYGHPPLSLNLHYIFTAFGEKDTAEHADLDAQHILGDVMRILHDIPIITPDLVEEKKVSKPRILDSSLLGQFEQIKITFQPASLEEISKIWTALPNVNFRRSVLYEVSVVQVQSKLPRSIALPVKMNRVYALPISTPLIQQIFRQPPIVDGQPVAAAEEGETLRLIGANFRSAATHVDIDGVTATISSISNNQMDVVVPTGALKIGLHSLQVEQDVALEEVQGQPPVTRTAFKSNVAGFMLLPRLGVVSPPTATAGATITANVTPAVQSTQEKVLLLGDHVIPAKPVAFDSPPSNTIDFVLPAATVVPPSNYFLRVRIDGAESRLTFNTTTQQYTGPLYTVT
jgi:hypothetical protein